MKVNEAYLFAFLSISMATLSIAAYKTLKLSFNMGKNEVKTVELYSINEPKEKVIISLSEWELLCFGIVCIALVFNMFILCVVIIRA